MAGRATMQISKDAARADGRIHVATVFEITHRTNTCVNNSAAVY